MLEIIFLLAVIAIVYFALKNNTAAKPLKKRVMPPQWLIKRWQESEDIEFRDMPHWFTDEVTKPQMRKLAELGYSLSSDALNKGVASDIIGLNTKPGIYELEKLDFFGLSSEELSETEARYKVEKLLKDPDNKLRWDNRP